MKIVYDDLVEFAEVRLRCENTRKKSMCKYCPFYERCNVCDNENLHVMCCEIEKERFFTPQEVQAMTRAEVREKYQAIMDSVKEWK